MAFESLKRLFRPDAVRMRGEALYAECVAAARAPALYERFGVRDTLDGRLGALMLHVFLVARALRGQGAPDPLGQAVFDAMTRDLDDTYREEGYGDAKVARLVRGAAERFYGQGLAYDAALRDGDLAALADALARNVLEDGGADASLLATYVARAVDTLVAEDLREGRAAFPDPEEPVHAAA